jgi:hypothetical protein
VKRSAAARSGRSARATPWLSQGAPNLILLGGIVLELIVLASLPIVYTVDGAMHVGGSAALGALVAGPPDVRWQYLELAWLPVPNLMPEVALALLQRIFDPGTAEKVLIAGYVVSFPLAFLYAVRSASASAFRRAGDWLGLLALPLTFTFLFSYGFYDFCYGTGLFLVTAGFALRHRERLDGSHAVMLCVLLLATYATHVVPYVEAALFVGTLVVWDWLAARHAGSAGWRDLVDRAIPPGLAAAPSVVLAVAFFIGTRGDQPVSFPSRLAELAGLLSLRLPLVTYDLREAAFALLLGLGLAGAGLAVLRARWLDAARLPRRWIPHLATADEGLAFAFLASVATVVAPWSVGNGGSVINERLALFPIYGFTLWLAAQPLGRRALAATALTGALAAAGLFAVRLPAYVELSQHVQDALAVAPCMAENATMVQVNLWRPNPGGMGLLTAMSEETGRLAAATHGLDLDNTEGSVPYFLIRWKPATDPHRFLMTKRFGFEIIPPGIDPLGYERRTGGQVDYILVQGRRMADPAVLSSADWQALQVQLAAGYRLVAISPMGLFEVWERTASPAAGAGVQRRAMPAGAACRAPVATGRGEPETAAEQRSDARGIVIDRIHADNLTALDERLGVPFPDLAS